MKKKYFDIKATKSEKQADSEVDKIIKGGGKKSKSKSKTRTYDENTVLKLLLLGAGETGKTTIFKQMELSQEDGFSPLYYEDMKKKLCGNILEGTSGLIEVMEETESFAEDVKDEGFKAASKLIKEKAAVYIGDANQSPYEDRVFEATELQQHESLDHVDAETHQALTTLWNFEPFKAALNQFQRRGKYNIADSYEEIMNKLVNNYPTWGGKDWDISDEDVLLARVRTTGFKDKAFQFGGFNIRLIDVGGQKSERRKWMHMFSGVSAVLFVAALSEYDQTLYEDDTTNRLVESVSVFEEFANQDAFQRSALLLLLNKEDLFRKKFLEDKIPLNISGNFEDAPTACESEEDLAEGIAFIESLFIKGLVPQKKESTFVYVTQALDKDKMTVVMESIMQHILKMNLEFSGIVNF